MDLRQSAVFVMAKQPLPGKCKTRLARHLSAKRACLFQEAFLRDTMDFVMEANVGGRFLSYWPPEGRDWFASTFVGIDLLQQPSQDLGASLITAFDQIFHLGYNAAVALGADTPDLPDGTIEQAVDALEEYDLVVGPTTDGGYYLIGLKEPAPELFLRIDWGTSAVLAETYDHASDLGLRVATLDDWYDIDEVEQLRRLAESETIRANSKAALEEIDISLSDTLKRAFPTFTKPLRGKDTTT
jgi:rSAM/selenodomain-associated transferase 1